MQGEGGLKIERHIPGTWIYIEGNSISRARKFRDDISQGSIRTIFSRDRLPKNPLAENVSLRGYFSEISLSDIYRDERLSGERK